MSLVTLTEPTGLDLAIDRYQKSQYNALGFSDHESYALAYMNLKNVQGKTGYIPEVFDGGNDYKDVLFNDGFEVSSFFYREPTTNHKDQVGTVRINQIFQVNLEKLFPTRSDRSNEYFNGLIERHNIYGFNDHDGFKLQKTVVNFEEVYQDFLIEYLNKYDDMQPFYVVRFEYLVRYIPGTIC